MDDLSSRCRESPLCHVSVCCLRTRSTLAGSRLPLVALVRRVDIFTIDLSIVSPSPLAKPRLWNAAPRHVATDLLGTDLVWNLHAVCDLGLHATALVAVHTMDAAKMTFSIL